MLSEWAAQKAMISLLFVTHDSTRPVKLLHVGVPTGSGTARADKNATPLAFVGKSVAFDTGGISRKPSADMKLTVCAATWTALQP